MTRDEHDRELFAQAFRPPGAEPYDLSQPFNADTLLDGFTEEETFIRAERGTPLGELVAAAREAWDDFVDEHGEPVE